MNITSFYQDVLGANLKNPRWSWGAFDPQNNRVFLRIWKDEIDTAKNRVRVFKQHTTTKSPGYNERKQHLARMQEGADGYGVVCARKDKEESKIDSFDDKTLLLLKPEPLQGGETFALVSKRIPVEKLAHQQTSQSTLTNELRAIFSRKIDATTKETLVDARVGQGRFRQDVLSLWNGCCAVTGSETKNIVRASHIKPWRSSSDVERLDPENGLPLTANLDALFDAGLISFAATGQMLLSRELDSEERTKLHLASLFLTKKPTPQTEEYLVYHRENIFRDNICTPPN